MQPIRRIISYGASLGIIILLLKYSFRQTSIKELASQVHQLKISWIIVSMLLSLGSHVVRAYRWNLLLKPVGVNLTLFKSFMALMLGYISNLLIPRLGEIVRSTALNRTTGIPVGIVLGTVAIERVIDLMGFIVVIIFTFLVSAKEIKTAFEIISFSEISYLSSFYGLLGIISFLGLLAFLGYRFYRRTPLNSFFLKSKLFMANLREGLYIIKGSSVKWYIVYTTIIKWVLYYLSEYVGIFAIPATSQLDWRVGFSVLYMSSLSFAVPVQGAIGAYHILVSSVLMGYGIALNDALLYATVLHVAHLLTIVLSTGIGIILQKIIN